jgi:phosphoglycerate dehydrogenase-like enzyme
MSRSSGEKMLQSLALHMHAASASSAVADEPDVVLALVPSGHRSLPILQAAFASAAVPSKLLQIQTAADIPSPCNARGMVVVHNQGGTLAGTLDTDAELRLALEPGVLPSLEWVHTMSAGVDHLPHELFAQHAPPITLTHNQGVSDQSLAEFAILGLLYFSKQVPLMTAQYNAEEWAGFQTRELRGATLGVIGLGSIGCEVVRAAVHGFGMSAMGYRRSSAVAPPTVEELVTMVPPDATGLAALLSASDFVVMALPHTAGTVHLLCAEQLALLKPSAVVVNIGRGSSIDALALAAALESGALRGAALDVVETEPLEDGHPLWAVGSEKLLLSPHTMDKCVCTHPTLRRLARPLLPHAVF